MTLLDIIKLVKIDFTQGLIEPDSGSAINYQLEITPKDFLGYSKLDFKSSDKRGNINALTNAKRAIDCQSDKIFYSLGLDPNNFPISIDEFICKSKNSPLKKDLPIRLKFLQALCFAPAEIIANARLLRNKLEHYYKRPSDEEVSNAIELAELFILATDSKLKDIWDFSITDIGKKDITEIHLKDCIYIRYNNKKSCFHIQCYAGKDERKEIEIRNTDTEFYFLFKIATSFDYNEDIQEATIDLLEFIGHPIPSKNVKLEIG